MLREEERKKDRRKEGKKERRKERKETHLAAPHSILPSIHDTNESSMSAYCWSVGMECVVFIYEGVCEAGMRYGRRFIHPPRWIAG